MIFGDVLAALAILVGIPFTTWAAIIACRLLFPTVSDRATDELAESPYMAFFAGLCAILVFGLIAIILLNMPNPVLKFIGFDIVSFLLAISVVGAGAISQIAGRRLQASGQNLSDHAAFTRGAGFFVIACMSPLVGWVFVLPISLVISVGTGIMAIRSRRKVIVPPTVV